MNYLFYVFFISSAFLTSILPSPKPVVYPELLDGLKIPIPDREYTLYDIDRVTITDQG
jgi:hypothetical protein